MSGALAIWAVGADVAFDCCVSVGALVGGGGAEAVATPWLWTLDDGVT
jgi:hypothetical protein